MRRHRTLIAGTVAGVVALAALSALYVVEVAAERDRARVEAAKSQAMTAFLLSLFEAGNPQEHPGEPLTATTLLEQGVARVEALEAQPEVKAQMLSAMAQAYFGLGETRTALALWEQTLALRRAHLDAHHPDVAHTIAHIGWSRLAADEYGAAAATFEEAIALLGASLGAEHPEVARSLSGLGLALNGMERREEAVAAIRRGLDIRRSTLGEQHLEVANGLQDLAIVRRAAGDLTAAEELLRQALELRSRLQPLAHPDIASNQKMLAAVLAARGDFAAAETLLLDALENVRQSLGMEHPHTRRLVLEIARQYDRYGRPAEAARYTAMLAHER